MATNKQCALCNNFVRSRAVDEMFCPACIDNLTLGWAVDFDPGDIYPYEYGMAMTDNEIDNLVRASEDALSSI